MSYQDYSHERYDPTLKRCGGLSLSFDGTKLTIMGAGFTKSYSAVSGQRKNGNFDYSVERQKQKVSGPIPAGSYWIRPDELWTNAWYKRGSYSAWGNYRITIHPRKNTDTYGRGGFFIHGGDTPGSIGCIDVAKDMDQFIDDLMKQVGRDKSCHIPLEVRY
jgi:hypothetical protein